MGTMICVLVASTARSVGLGVVRKLGWTSN